MAYFAPTLAPQLLGALSITATAGAVAAATAVITAAGAFLAGAVASALTAKPSTASTSTPGIFRQALASSFIVYGKRRVGGLLIFFHPRTVGKDQYRYFVIAVAGHRCKGAVRWFLGDDVVSVNGAGMVTSGTYANNAWLWLARGTEDQQANPTFVAETDGKWSAAHRGRSTTLIYAKFKMVDAVVQAGMPNITVELEGKDDILDVRTGEQGYTRNAQLVFRDFMAMPREEGGFGCYPDELDGDWDAAQANVCDEPVALAAGGTEPRYAFDSYITTGAAPSEVRDTFVTCCAGTFTYSGGKMLMRPGYYVPPSANLSENDLAGAISVPALLSSDQVVNEVTGTYINPLTLYQAADAPTRSIPSNDVRQAAVDLPHVTSGTMAQRVMEISLRKAQAERRVTWPMNIMGLAISTLDTVRLDTTRYGLSNYAFQTVGWGLSQDFSVVLQLEETGPDIFHWTPSMELVVGQGGELVKATPIEVAPAGSVQAAIFSSFIVEVTAGIGVVAASSDGMITIANHTRRYPDGHADVAVTGGTIATGLPAGTTISIAYDDPDRAGGAVTFAVYEDDADAFASAAHPARHYMGFVTIPATGTSTGGGGGTPGGRETVCVADDTAILLANLDRTGAGETKPASAVTTDDWVWTQHEVTRAWGAYPVIDISFHDADVFAADGLPLATAEHQFDRDGWWKKAKMLGQPAGRQRVAKITVSEARTYVTVQPDGVQVLNHNIKQTDQGDT